MRWAHLFGAVRRFIALAACLLALPIAASAADQQTFATPEAAVAALSAALKAQHNILAETWSGFSPLRVRMALHTGSVQEREGTYWGIRTDIALPMLIVGRGGLMSSLDIPRLLVPLQTRVGDTLHGLVTRVLDRLPHMQR